MPGEQKLPGPPRDSPASCTCFTALVISAFSASVSSAVTGAATGTTAKKAPAVTRCAQETPAHSPGGAICLSPHPACAFGQEATAMLHQQRQLKKKDSGQPGPAALQTLGRGEWGCIGTAGRGGWPGVLSFWPHPPPTSSHSGCAGCPSPHSQHWGREQCRPSWRHFITASHSPRGTWDTHKKPEPPLRPSVLHPARAGQAPFQPEGAPTHL